MTDAGAVRAAAEGCDALVHAAATYSFRRSDRRADGAPTTPPAPRPSSAPPVTRAAGWRCTSPPRWRWRGRAASRSTTAARWVRATGPTATARWPRSASPGAMQEAGDPVTIVNPGGVIGPHDPYLGETNEILVQVLTGQAAGLPARAPAVRRRARRGGGDRRGARPRAGRALPRSRARLRRAPRGAAAGDRSAAAGADAARGAGARPGDARLPHRLVVPARRGRGRADQPGAATPMDTSRTTADLGVSARRQEEALRPTPCAGSWRPVTCRRSWPGGPCPDPRRGVVSADGHVASTSPGARFVPCAAGAGAPRGHRDVGGHPRGGSGAVRRVARHPRLTG